MSRDSKSWFGGLSSGNPRLEWLPSRSVQISSKNSAESIGHGIIGLARVLMETITFLISCLGFMKVVRSWRWRTPSVNFLYSAFNRITSRRVIKEDLARTVVAIATIIRLMQLYHVCASVQSYDLYIYRIPFTPNNMCILLSTLLQIYSWRLREVQWPIP